MAKNIMFVFIGKPGAGKTTLIKKFRPNAHIIDVLSFVKTYEINGMIPEEKTLLAYNDMYNSFDIIKDKTILLELGTNYPELNIAQLEKMQNKYKVVIYLCNASVETCRKRANTRGRQIDTEALERRLNRNFPLSHLKLLENNSLKYIMLNMETTLEENIKIINKFWR